MDNFCSSLLLILPIFFSGFIYSLGKLKKYRYIFHLIFTLCYFSMALIFLIYGIKADTIIPVSGWHFSFSIVLNFDFITRLFLTIFSFVGILATVYMFNDDQLDNQSASFYVGFWLLILATVGILSTQDLFNLYVWLEVMLVASVAIITSSKNVNLKEALKEYGFINIFSTLLILLSIGLIYGQTGILSYSGVANYISSHNTFVVGSFYLLLIGLLIKGASFPFYFWLPKTYSSISITSTLMLSSFNTKLIMIIILRLFIIWKQSLFNDNINAVLAVSGIVTMFFGVMGAANQYDIKRILSYHITSQIGYILLAISLASKLGFIAAIFFIIHNIFTKSTLFVAVGYMHRKFNTTNLSDLGSVFSLGRINGFVFFIAAMSLAGFPPLSGFIAKYLVLKSVLFKREYVSGFFVLFVSLFTLYSMIKVWRYGFCQANKIKGPIANCMTSVPLNFYICALLFLLSMIFISVDPDAILIPLTKALV